MKTCFLIVSFFLFLYASIAQSPVKYQIFTCSSPAGFTLLDKGDKLFYQINEGNTYCQLYLWPAINGQGDVEKDFSRDWDSFAKRPYQLDAPETKDNLSAEGWQVIQAAARGTYNNIQFVISISTYTRENITYSIVGVMNDRKYLGSMEAFARSVSPDLRKFNSANQPVTNGITNTGKYIGMAKPRTSFDDGWTADALTGFVQVKKGNTEIRLHYPDNALDNARSNLIDPTDYYWNLYVTPGFRVSEVRKWSGVEYPVIYFIQGKAISKETGAPCFVALKIVYSGGARPIVVITPDQQSYDRQFPHPNNLDPLLSYNKFAVTEKDIIGTWNGGAGAGVDYYNAYTGNYISTHTISTSDEFTFKTDGTYSSTYRSANINGGSSQFGGQDFRGKFSCTNWQLTATNRFRGATTRFTAQLIAVKGGYLLYLQDPQNSSMQYTLFRSR